MTKQNCNSSPPRVLCIGELNVDIIVEDVERLPSNGEEILVKYMAIHLGSSSAIFACGLARLGVPVTFFGKVGTDEWGAYIIKILNEQGVDTQNVNQCASLPTGATISIAGGAEKRQMTFLGSIDALGGDEIPNDIFCGFDHLHLTSYFLQSKLRPYFSPILNRAHDLGISTSIDPGYVPYSLSAEVATVLAQSDLVFMNRYTAAMICGGDNISNISGLLRDRTQGIFVTRGAAGASLVSIDSTYEAKSLSVKERDSTGAGDSFASGVIWGYLTGLSLPQTLSAGCVCGACCVQELGGIAGQPDAHTVLRLMPDVEVHEIK